MTNYAPVMKDDKFKKKKERRHVDVWVQTLSSAVIFTTLLSVVAIRKTCGAGGQNRAQLQPTKRCTSWSGESSTPGLGRQTESKLSSVYVNDGV